MKSYIEIVKMVDECFPEATEDQRLKYHNCLNKIWGNMARPKKIDPMRMSDKQFAEYCKLEERRRKLLEAKGIQPLLDMDDFALMFKSHPKTIQNLMLSKGIPHIKHGGELRFTKEHINDYIKYYQTNTTVNRHDLLVSEGEEALKDLDEQIDKEVENEYPRHR